MNLKAIKFDERGLIPAIVQDARTREVLTLAYMNEESLRRTIEMGETWFWSRSRAQLWHKGETSGHTQQVISITLDCDRDALLLDVVPNGPACHTGDTSCFHDVIHSKQDEGLPAMTLFDLYSVIASRKQEMPEGSYTAYLFQQGLDKILKKVGEECSETIIAAKNPDRDAFVGEVSDLIYHLLVLLVERGITLEAVNGKLASRHSSGREPRDAS